MMPIELSCATQGSEHRHVFQPRDCRASTAHRLRMTELGHRGRCFRRAFWVNRGLSVSHAHTGNRLAAFDSIDALRRYSSDLSISEVVSSIPFTQNFLDRI